MIGYFVLFPLVITSIVFYYVFLPLPDVAGADLDGLFSGFYLAGVYAFIPLVLLPLFVSYVFKKFMRYRFERDLNSEVSSLGFSSSCRISNGNEIRVDLEAGNVCLVTVDQSEKNLIKGAGAARDVRVLPFGNILSVSIVEDGETVTKADRKDGSILGRAVIGGLLFGGAGAVVGGLSAIGSKSSLSSGDVVRSLQLELVLEDPEHPVHRVSLFDDLPLEVGGSSYKTEKKRAMYWQSLLEMVMAGVDIPDHGTYDELLDYARMISARKTV